MDSWVPGSHPQMASRSGALTINTNILYICVPTTHYYPYILWAFVITHKPSINHTSTHHSHIAAYPRIFLYVNHALIFMFHQPSITDTTLPTIFGFGGTPFLDTTWILPFLFRWLWIAAVGIELHFPERAMDSGALPLEDQVREAEEAGARMMFKRTKVMAGVKVFHHPLKFTVSEPCLQIIW